MTGWKRRSRAASFSMCLRYSSRVVAPITCSSPRAMAGFRRLEASMAPSALPAPTSVWTSSISRITFSFFVASSMTFFRRSSNCPRYWVPATKAPMSMDQTWAVCRDGGTLPSAMRCARPSAMAVFPTPGRPIRQGLFLLRRLRICVTRSICNSRPTTGSSFPSSASLVRFVVNCSIVDMSFLPPTPTCSGFSPPSFWIRSYKSLVTLLGLAPSSCRICTPGLSRSDSNARSRCSVPTNPDLRVLDSVWAFSRIRLHRGVKAISVEVEPGPGPRTAFTLSRALFSLSPLALRTWAANPESSPISPRSSCSEPISA
mmetsp:Transcript_88408/g.153472  ORF Transcript_88408/g.153472 Transcript_88408/m.153472 type:complete len:315 (+) Transcript_88408:1283-2227(+)